MFEFNIVESTETGERAYYVNGVRFDRAVWRECMEAELESLNRAREFELVAIKGFDTAIRGAQKHMEGKATFDLPSNARAFYRQVIKEIREQKRECVSMLETINSDIEDFQDKLED